MINEKLETLINDQIKAEFYSAYLYLSMSAYFDRINLQGFKNWVEIQAKEECEHAMGFFKYLQDRGGKVELLEIKKPKYEWSSPVQVFEDILAHEKEITIKIYALADIAEEEKDRAMLAFLDWYIKEQVEEEVNSTNVLKSLKLICGDKHGLHLLDDRLSKREYKKREID